MWYIIHKKAVIIMYQILEDPKVMSSEEINKMFDGKWVYIVKAVVTKHGELIDGIPVIVADTPFEGNNDGIYEQYDTAEYAKKFDYDLNHYEPFISSVYSVEFV
jgi:predicted secreted protein